MLNRVISDHQHIWTYMVQKEDKKILHIQMYLYKTYLIKGPGNL